MRQNSKLHDAAKGLTTNVGWNFGKFLVNEKGEVVEYYEPSVEPNAIVADIRKLTAWSSPLSSKMSKTGTNRSCCW